MINPIGLGQLRNSAAHYFDRVEAGEAFDVVRRGRIVARIVPLHEGTGVTPAPPLRDDTGNRKSEGN